MEQRDRKRKRLTRPALVLLLLLFILLIVAVAIKCSGRTKAPAGIPATAVSETVPVTFLELVYEQSFAPFTEESTQSNADLGWNRLSTYHYQPLTSTLYPSSGEHPAAVEPSPGFVVGKRLEFKHHLWPHSLDSIALLDVPIESSVIWNVAEDPSIFRLASFDGLCHLRLPLDVQVSVMGDRATVTVNGESRDVLPGNTIKFPSASRSFSLEDFVNAMNAALSAVEGDERVTREMIERHGRKIGLAPESDVVTLHGRITATNHKDAQLSSLDLAALSKEADNSMRSGDFDDAAARLQILANILPDDKDVSDQLAYALHPPEQSSELVSLSGKIEFPDSEPTKGTRVPPYLRAIRSSDGEVFVEYLQEPGFYQVHLPPADYSVELTFPGFRTISFETELRESAVKNLTLTRE